MWNAHYNIFGKIDKLTINEVHNPIRMQGQYEDEETGLYYNRYRYYDPNISAYVSQDPLGLGAGENVYSYVKNSFGWIDPMGLSCKKSGSSSGKENFENNSRTNSEKSNIVDKGKRSKNKLAPDPNAEGRAHSTFKVDSEGNITNYETYTPNPNNPKTGLDLEKRYDGVGEPHYNKVTKEELLPHVHDKTAIGGVRTPKVEEIPNNNK